MIAGDFNARIEIRATGKAFSWENSAFRECFYKTELSSKKKPLQRNNRSMKLNLSLVKVKNNAWQNYMYFILVLHLCIFFAIKSYFCKNLTKLIRIAYIHPSRFTLVINALCTAMNKLSQANPQLI